MNKLGNIYKRHNKEWILINHFCLKCNKIMSAKKTLFVKNHESQCDVITDQKLKQQ